MIRPHRDDWMTAKILADLQQSWKDSEKIRLINIGQVAAYFKEIGPRPGSPSASSIF